MEHIRQNLRWHKHNQKEIFNIYESPSQKIQSTLVGKCLFCGIVQKKIEKLEYEDSEIAIFLDKDQRAKKYYQCSPFRHIRDVNHLRPRLK